MHLASERLKPAPSPNVCEVLLALMQMDQEYVIVRHRLDAAESIAEHFHPKANEWVIIERGAIEVTIDGAKRKHHLDGTALAIPFPAGARHALKALSAVEYVVLRDREDEIIYSAQEQQ